MEFVLSLILFSINYTILKNKVPILLKYSSVVKNLLSFITCNSFKNYYETHFYEYDVL